MSPQANLNKETPENKKAITDVIDIYEATGDMIRAKLYKSIRYAIKDMKKRLSELDQIIQELNSENEE